MFILNKTAWAYFGCANPQGVVQRAKAKRVTVLRVALEGTPYWDDLGIEMWPWGGTRRQPDWSSWHEAYWQEVQRRVRLAGEHGIGLDVVLYFTLHPDAADMARQRLYWQQAIRRLGGYANVLTWEIANEYVANETFQDAAGEFFASHDRWRRPVCTSDGTTDDAVWPNKPWMGLAINHTCTSSSQPHGLRDWYLALARNTRAHAKPAWCNESGRERRHGNDDAVHRRKQGWLWNAAGCFWTHHSWDGCEGIDDPDYHVPGEQFLKPMSEFWQDLPFWSLAPNHTALVIHGSTLVWASLADADRGTCVAYACTEQSGAAVSDAALAVRLPPGAYEVRLVNPADNSVLQRRSLESPGGQRPQIIPLPEFTDDLAVLVLRCR